MPRPQAPGAAPVAPLRGELRYGVELAQLLADRNFLRPPRPEKAPPVLLVPGFMAGDPSLAVLAGWLRRRVSRTERAGMIANADCAERAVTRVEARLERLAERAGEPVVVLGQSRGGGLARALAVRRPDLVDALVMLGSPVLAPLDVGPAVFGAVRWVAWLGDRGVPGVFSTQCGDGDCCAAFRDDLIAPLPESVRALAIYSRSDGIVSWPACLDPWAEHVEVDSSHTGMSVNADVYRVFGGVLDGARAEPQRRGNSRRPQSAARAKSSRRSR